MKKLWPLLLVMLASCACTQYQVVQEVQVNMYHMHHPKKGVQIILTKDTLEVGKWYRLSSIKNIDIKNDE
tara:strand:- start:2206 stop:2415 length:210 start_codon:yes stop_codon:yes gene_type:complete